MKNFSKNWQPKRSLLFASLGSAALLSGCFDLGFGGDDDDTTVDIVAPDQLPQDLGSASLVVLNTDSGLPLAGPVQFELFADTNVLNDIEIENLTSLGGNKYSSEDATIYIKRLTPGGDNYEIKIVVIVEGYFKSSIYLTLSSDGSIIDSKTLNLTKEVMDESQTDHAGIITTQRELVADANGEINDSVTIRTVSSPQPGQNEGDILSTVTIPANTVVTDENGNPVTGNLKLNLAFFPTNNGSSEITATSALESFPGGMTVTANNFNIADSIAPGDAPNSGEDFDFISMGFVALKIQDENGNKVKSFSNPIDIEIMVPPTTVNPEGERPVQEGDRIPVWSYNTSNGIWTLEGHSVLGAVNSDGNFPAAFSTDHLSFFNLDYFSRSSCDVKDIRVEDAFGNTQSMPLTAVFQRAGWKKTGKYKGDGTLDIARAPEFNNTRFTLLDNSNNKVLTSVRLSDGTEISTDNGEYSGSLCDLNSATLVTGEATPSFNFNVDMSFTTVCKQDSDKKTQQYRSAWLYKHYQSPKGYTDYEFITTVKLLSDDTVSLKLPEGTYLLKTIYGDRFNPEQYFKTDFTVTSDDTIDWHVPVICEERPITGATGGTGATGASGSL